jgi:uncharacterized protein
MESCLYEGWVAHHRGGDVPHAFRFPLAMLYLDLDELDAVFRGRWAWSARRPALAWVRRGDHLGASDVPLATAVRDLVEARIGVRPAGPIRLLTHPRYAGYVFNPLSLFYCFGAAGDRLQAVVADVTNTPWGERHQYVLAAAPEAGRSDPGAPDRYPRHGKAFHVSPFLPMALDYDWRIGRPGRSLGVRIAAHARDVAAPAAPIFTARLALRRRPIDGRSLAGVLVRFSPADRPGRLARQPGRRSRRPGAHPRPRRRGRPGRARPPPMAAVLPGVRRAVRHGPRHRMGCRPLSLHAPDRRRACWRSTMTGRALLIGGCLATMTAAVTYGLVAGDFWRDGRVIMRLPWGVISVIDVYAGGALFSGWIAARERSVLRTAGWVVAIFVLGNVATSLYALIALRTSDGDATLFWLGPHARA